MKPDVTDTHSTAAANTLQMNISFVQVIISHAYKESIQMMKSIVLICFSQTQITEGFSYFGTRAQFFRRRSHMRGCPQGPHQQERRRLKHSPAHDR